MLTVGGGNGLNGKSTTNNNTTTTNNIRQLSPPTNKSHSPSSPNNNSNNVYTTTTSSSNTTTTTTNYNNLNIPGLLISSDNNSSSLSFLSNSISNNSAPSLSSLNDSSSSPAKYVKPHRTRKGLFGQQKRNSSVKYANSIVSMRTLDDDRRITIHGNVISNQMLMGLDENGSGSRNLYLASDLPIEILIKIFTYLNGISFYRVCLACKSWYRACEDEILWEQVCNMIYPNETHKMQKSNNRRNKITKFKNIYSEIVYNDIVLLKTGSFEKKEIKFKKSPWSKEDYIFYHSNNNNNNGNSNTGASSSNSNLLNHSVLVATGSEENVLSISPSSAVNQSMPVKIVVVGDGAVGKTSLLGRFANDEFLSDQYLPTIFDNFTTYSTFDNRTWAVTIIDTAGSEDYDKIRPLSYTGCDLFICCFDLMNTSSFQNVSNIWIKELNSCAPNVPILLCGTKLDLRISNANESGSLKYYIDSKFSKYGVVTFDEGVALANKTNNCVGYIETSAKSGQGVKKCIETGISYSCKYSLSQLVRYLPRSPTTGSPNSDNGTIPNKPNKPNKRNSNCVIE